MYLAKVIGTVVSTSKNESLKGTKLLIVGKIDENLNSTNESEIAVDSVGAGNGEIVIVTKGNSARYAIGQKESAVDAAIVGIVDTVETRK